MFLLWSHCDHLINRRQVRCIVLQGVTGIDRSSDIIPDLPFDPSTFSSFFLFFPLFLYLFFLFFSLEIRDFDRGTDSWENIGKKKRIWRSSFLFLGTNLFDWSNQSLPRIYRICTFFPISFRSVTFPDVFAKNFLGRFPHQWFAPFTNPELIYIQNSTCSIQNPY